MEIPKYLVQLPTGQLYGYWRKDLLLRDVYLNKEEGKIKVFELDKTTPVVKYNPIEIEDINGK